MQYAVDSIRTEILDAVTNDDLLLPTMPEVALRLREVANDPEVDAHAIAGVIGSDAALSARIIKVANSPLIRGLQTVEDLQMAVSRMGIAYATNRHGAAIHGHLRSRGYANARNLGTQHPGREPELRSVQTLHQVTA